MPSNGVIVSIHLLQIANSGSPPAASFCCKSQLRLDRPVIAGVLHGGVHGCGSGSGDSTLFKRIIGRTGGISLRWDCIVVSVRI